MEKKHSNPEISKFDIDDEFQQLWRMEKTGEGLEEFISDNNIDRDFMVDVSLDWDSLKSIGKRDTELEKLWAYIGQLSNNQVILAGVASILISPFLLILTYNWTRPKLISGDWLPIFTGGIILLAMIGLAAMLIGWPLHVLMSRFKTPAKIIHIFRKTRGWLTLAACTCVVLLCLMVINSAYLNPVLPAHEDIADFKSVVIDGKEKLVASRYYDDLKKHPEKFTIKFDSTKASYNAILNKDPEYLNAVALNYQKNGKKFESILISSIADQRTDTTKMTANQTNVLTELSDAQHKDVEYIPNLNRIFYSKYLSCVSIKQNTCAVSDSLLKMSDSSIKRLEYLNLKALTLEQLGRPELALETYQFALNHRESDIVTMFNVRKLIEHAPEFSAKFTARKNDSTHVYFIRKE